jgi:penicillin-binding protein 1A
MKRFRAPSRRLVSVLLALHVATALAGVGVALLLSRDMPGIDNLDLQSLPQVTVLQDRDGEFLHSFAKQRRIPVPLNEVSPWFLKAIIATEDPRFERHFGVDPIAVGRAVWSTLRTLDYGREGASTITMQLARDQFLHRRKTIWRKIQEALLATQIEKHYTKEEILALYCNRIYLGRGRYGVEAAARHLFGKSSEDLALHEAALLAGLPQAPERLSPLKSPQRARARRNHVLRRMAIEGVIPQAQAEEAMKAPLGHVEPVPRRPFAPYFVEEVRRWLLDEFGEEALYQEGLVVRTTVDRRLQAAAERAVAHGLELYGRRHEQLPSGAPLPDDVAPAEYEDPAWSVALQPDDIVPALVLGTDEDAATARVRIGDAELTLDRKAIAWTGQRNPARLVEPDTLVPVRVTAVDEHAAPTAVELASSPSPEAALVAMDVATGEILALVGGKDFELSEFDRAMQAYRQAGSAFKPFIFAAALEMGFLPNQPIPDVPTVVVDAGTEGPYQPENYERDYEGFVTMRHALEHSRNIATLRLLDAVGYDPAVEIARRLGIASSLRAYPSLSLGAFEVRLVDLVAAYASFANGGVLVAPQLVRQVRHPEQQELYTPTRDAREVLSPEVAAMMTGMLEGVVLRGTGQQARALRRPVGGKTGTTDDYTNAWFVGFTPSIALGVWVGHDQNSESLGRGESGARAALPIWVRFFAEGLGMPTPENPAEEFVRPPNVHRTLVDRKTGLRSGGGDVCGEALLELFPLGRGPQRWCTARDQLRARLPYPLQAYPIDSGGRLTIPPRELAQMVAAVPDRLTPVSGGRALHFAWNEGRKNEQVGTILLDWERSDWEAYLAAFPIAVEDARLREFEREEFVAEYDDEEIDVETAMPAGLRDGADGFPAFVLPANRSGEVRDFDYPDDP